MMKVSVVIPTRGDRNERLRGCIEQLQLVSPQVETVVVSDGINWDVSDIASDLGCVLLVAEDAPGAVECWNRGAAIASGDIFMLGADDLDFKDGWLEAGLAALAKMNWNGLVAVNDLSPNAGALATHYLVSKNYAVNEMGGCLAIPDYDHCFIDTEVTYRAKRDGRFFYAEDCIVEHNHHLWEKAEMDDTYAKGWESYNSGMALFEQREKCGFPNTWEPYFTMTDRAEDGWGKVAVGTRIFKDADGDFFNSWTMLLLTGLEKGDAVLFAPIGKPAHIAANQVVGGFLNSKCDSVLFVDSDMEFPADSLRKLRNNKDNWDYDIVMGFCTHKTIPPHAVVLELNENQPGLPLSLKGEHYGALRNIPDNSVIDVDAVGLAFTLIKRHVLEAMVNEYGVLYTPFFEWGKFNEGEDITFSRLCRENGFTLAVDTNVKIDHLGKYAFGWRSFHEYLEQEQRTKV